MMNIVYICECGKIYRFKKQFAGRVSRCINCRREYVVPQTADDGPPPVGNGAEIDDFVIQDISPEIDTSNGTNDSPSAVSPENSHEDAAVVGLESPPDSSPDRGSGSTISVMYTPNRRTEDPTVLQQLGRYQIHERIGSGGMGNVYYAWDTELQREVTIKTTNKKGRQYKNYKTRFVNEARIAGKLVHSGIITIYSLDYDDAGEPYYAMRLLEGRTLEQLVTQYHNIQSPAHTPEQLRKLIRHFIDACETMAYVHDNHVVHRDIKPANIMLGGYGETVVLDWGLAKTLSTEKKDEELPDEIGDDDIAALTATPAEDVPEQTRVGVRVGTAGYQSPEYLRGEDSRCSDDIYALGVTLYVILCNKMPYAAAKDRRGLYEMMMTPPKPPQLLNAHVDKSLAAVCLCALAFEKEKRYSTAALLATDLQRWLDGEPVAAYRLKTSEKILALLGKRATLIGGLLVSFVLGFFLARLLYST